MAAAHHSKKGFRTLSIGGATYDLFVRIGDDLVKSHEIVLPVGGKIRVQEVIETCGGGATNTAIGLSRLGCSASFCGVVGDDQWGDRILENLKKEKVNSDSTTIIEDEMSSFSIIFNTEKGERVILYATSIGAHLHDVTFDREAIAKTDWVYFNHIHEKSCVIQDDLVVALKDNRTTGMSWNPGGRQLKRGIDDADNCALLSRTTLLLLNKEEALAFSGKQTIERAIERLLECGVQNICITDGANGCTASDGRSLFHCPVVKDAKIIDTTGAGDAFGTGATWALIQGLDLPNALRAGTINATIVLAAIGAQAGLLTDTEMQKQLATMQLPVDVKPLR